MMTKSPKERSKARGPVAAVAAIAICAVMAIALTACSGNSAKKGTAAKAEAKTVGVAINVTADSSWNQKSTPVIAHVEGKDGSDAEGVDFYHAVIADKKGGKGSSTVKLAKGEYTMSFISPVNADGSVFDIYATGAPVSVKVESGSGKAPSANCSMKQIPADKVTDDMLKDIVDKTKNAIKGGDKTLKGDTGKDILSRLDDNIASNPNASDDTKKDASDAVKDSGVNDAPASTTPATDKTNTGKTNTGNKGSNNSGSSNANTNNGSTNNNASSGNQQSETKPAHVHKWRDHVGTFTVYDDHWVDVPDYENKQVPVGTKYIFAEDGYTTTDANDASNHSVQLMQNGGMGNYRTETVYETQRVQVGSHKENQQTSHLETRADFKYCEECGAIEYYTR